MLNPGSGAASGRPWTSLLASQRSAVRQFARYLAVGGVAFAVDFSFLYGLTEFGRYSYLTSAAIAFLLGLIVNYWLSRAWVFDRRAVSNTGLEFVLFSLVGIIGLGVNQSVIWFATETMQLHYMLAKLATAGIVLAWNFAARKYLLFSDNRLAVRVTSLAGTRTSIIVSLGVASVYFAICVAVQSLTYTVDDSFTAYPDESAHFVGAAMIADWLGSDHWFQPLRYATNFYDHYPLFALGYWPPLFSIITGLWMKLTGVGRLQALIVPAAFAAGTAWLIFRLVRHRIGTISAVLAGALYLSLPEVRKWMCAVMVDHMTAFFCLTAAAILIRYFSEPSFRNGMLFGVACGCAILSKYSAIYLVVIPVISLLALRRMAWLKRPDFLVQPPVIGLMVVPWVLWTRHLAYYGLPADRETLSAERVISFIYWTLRIFPSGVLIGLLIGVVILLVRRTTWRPNIAILGLLFMGHICFLVISPVGAEARYLLLPAATLMILSLIGWSEVLPYIKHARPVLMLLLTVALVASMSRHAIATPQHTLRNAVAFVVKDSARARCRIIVPPNLEGPAIAEFVAQSSTRPDHFLVRPGKRFTHRDWFGRNYSLSVLTPAEMMDDLNRWPVDFVIWDERGGATGVPHEVIMRDMLARYPESWHREMSFGCSGGSQCSTTVYKYVPAHR